MSECTQPELWANRPGSNASEEEVARYMDHLDQCPFHAAMENADERVVSGMAAFANSEPAAAQTTVERPAPAPGRQLPWAIVWKVAAAVALAAGMVLLSIFYLRTRPQSEEVRMPRESPTPSPSPANEVITNSNTAPAPSPVPDVNSNRDVPATLTTVRRIYVGPAEGEYNQVLRAALIAELKQNGAQFSIVSRAEEADAVLQIENTRGPNVRVQLANRAGRPLWFTTQSTSDESEAATKELATRIIRELYYQARP